MKVLGLDLSMKSTGICLLDGDSLDSLSVRTELFKQPSTKGVEEGVRRLLAISEKVVSLVRAESPHHVIIEAAAKNQVWQAAAMGEVHGAVKSHLLRETGIIPLVKEATEMRKVVIGKIERKMVEYTDRNGNKKRRVSYGDIVGPRGKPKRASVKDLIQLRLADLGLRFDTQDEMDAYVAARYCWVKVGVLDKGSTHDPDKA